MKKNIKTSHSFCILSFVIAHVGNNLAWFDKDHEKAIIECKLFYDRIAKVYSEYPERFIFFLRKDKREYVLENYFKDIIKDKFSKKDTISGFKFVHFGTKYVIFEYSRNNTVSLGIAKIINRLQ